MNEEMNSDEVVGPAYRARGITATYLRGITDDLERGSRTARVTSLIRPARPGS